MWMCAFEEPSYYKYYVELYIFREQKNHEYFSMSVIFRDI